MQVSVENTPKNKEFKPGMFITYESQYAVILRLLDNDMFYVLELTKNKIYYDVHLSDWIPVPEGTKIVLSF